MELRERELNSLPAVPIAHLSFTSSYIGSGSTPEFLRSVQLSLSIFQNETVGLSPITDLLGNSCRFVLNVHKILDRMHIIRM